MFKVILTDERYPNYETNRIYFAEASEWAQKYCPSFVSMDITDVSDVSGQWDQLAEYEFTDDKDLAFFILRWK